LAGEQRTLSSDSEVRGRLLKASDDWIAQHVGGGSATGATAELFKRFLTQKHIDNVAPEDSAALFRQFLEWKERQPSAR
jgi:hypothetical protein